MDLWIMSQDKEKIIQVKYLEIGIFSKHFIIIDCTYKDEEVILGDYKTKERALEVLKDINNIKYFKYLASLDFDTFIKAIKDYDRKTQLELLSKMNTYEMPKE